MSNRRDSHQPGFDDELEHGWAGGLEIEVGDERPNTGLGSDPGARKWMLGGLGVSCLLIATVVLLATHDIAPVHAAEIEAAPEPSSELVPTPSEAHSAPSKPSPSLVATSPAPRRASESNSARPSPVAAVQPSSKADSTFAAGSSVAVQTKPHASTPPKPANTKPAATPQPTANTKPTATPKPAAPSKPAVTPSPKPVEPVDISKLPSGELPDDTDAQLPDVEPWDDADDEAASDDSTIPATPS